MRGVICNTSPLQYLYQTDLLHLLPTLFESAQVPPAVAAELAEGKRHGIRLPELAEISWITVRSVRDRTLLPLVANLGNGEKEVLALGMETPGHLLVLDDRNARRYANAAGLESTGTLGILVLAKERGVIETVRPILDHLQDMQFRVDAATREMVLDMAEEPH
ncbi:MAG: DUF3368 domain-containing protein [Gammaproteobacteria bacterium]|nr:DUF3368 domain-containing protein [Gammaproteobacteria bacterium]